MIATIEPMGWLLVALAGCGMLGAVTYLVATMPDEWDSDAMERAEQPCGFRVIGPVRRPPFDWSAYPEFTAGAWHDDDDLDTDPGAEHLDAEQRWYALHDGWVQ
jgi:hypothetical protein